jgi:hypothetical protein
MRDCRCYEELIGNFKTKNLAKHKMKNYFLKIYIPLILSKNFKFEKTIEIIEHNSHFIIYETNLDKMIEICNEKPNCEEYLFSKEDILKIVNDNIY